MEKKRCLIYSDPDPMSRINKLPDELLVLILSKLTIKDVSRTRVLSRRWKNLWVYYAGSLNFDKVGASYKFDRLYVERSMFISWVNHVLNFLRVKTIDEFRVCFNLDASNGDDIDRWIEFAMEKKVSRFEMDLSEFNTINFNDELYVFPNKLLGSPNYALRCFGSLTSLRLIFVDIYDQVLANLLSNCPALEHLSIKNAPSLTYINATTALKLKHFEIQQCYYLRNVDISNTNIESLKFDGRWGTQLSLEKLRFLSEVSLGGTWCHRVVCHNFQPLPISQLQRLELNLGDSFLTGEIEFPEVFPTLFNLKHLKVRLLAAYEQNFFCLTSLICAFPHLNSFTLEVIYAAPEPPEFMRYFELPNCEWRKSEKRVHECLKVVEFTGWCGYKCDLDIVYYLIDKSAVLEKLIIAPCDLRHLGIRSTLHEHKDKVTRDGVKLLQKCVPPAIQLVII